MAEAAAPVSPSKDYEDVVTLIVPELDLKEIYSTTDVVQVRSIDFRPDGTLILIQNVDGYKSKVKILDFMSQINLGMFEKEKKSMTKAFDVSYHLSGIVALEYTDQDFVTTGEGKKEEPKLMVNNLTQV